MYRILVINPGSTSTKMAVFEDNAPVLEATLRHSAEDLEEWGSIPSQKPYRKALIEQALEKAGIGLHTLHAVVGRGGMVRPIESGTYEINEKMLEDLNGPGAASHASSLGGLIAYEFGAELGIPAYVVDPIVVDELEPVAKLSGLAGIERRSIFHALNTKSVLRKVARGLGMPYEDGRFIAVHMGGGITVSAHRYGRVIDVNSALDGDGAFTPDRTGSLPLLPLIEMCYSGDYTKEEMIEKVQRKGGLYSYLNTNDMIEAGNMVKQGDEFASLVIDSMAYQICKEIGAMFAVLEGRVNAIVLTGGIAYDQRFTALIKKRVDMLCPVITHAGENELEALAEGALRVLCGQEKASIY